MDGGVGNVFSMRGMVIGFGLSIFGDLHKSQPAAVGEKLHGVLAAGIEHHGSCREIAGESQANRGGGYASGNGERREACRAAGLQPVV